jgi:aerobic carbon-monoxide dehydrogenase small subunit
METRVRLAVNGQAVDRVVDVRRSLGDFLREDLGLTGTHLGCEHGVCGACTVLVDGESARACLLLAVQLDGAAVRRSRGSPRPTGSARCRRPSASATACSAASARRA